MQENWTLPNTLESCVPEGLNAHISGDLCESMELSIPPNSFAAVFVSVLSVILTMSAATGWTQRGFIGYLNDQGIARLEKSPDTAGRALWQGRQLGWGSR